MVSRILIILMIGLLFEQPMAKDPTRPLLPAAGSSVIEQKNNSNKKSSLTAILKKNGNYYAIIGDKLYQKDDSYAGKKIIEITHNKVVLLSDQGRKNLYLFTSVKS